MPRASSKIEISAKIRGMPTRVNSTMLLPRRDPNVLFMSVPPPHAYGAGDGVLPGKARKGEHLHRRVPHPNLRRIGGAVRTCRRENRGGGHLEIGARVAGRARG